MFRAVTVLAFTLLIFGCGGEKTEPPADNATATPANTAAYLGQTPPGMTPELFAPDILPTEGVQHCLPAFSPDGLEVYWTTFNLEGERPRAEIFFMEEADGTWSEPAMAPFSGSFSDFSPVFSHDGRRLYFGSLRPDSYGMLHNIWYVERTDTGWSEPYNLGSPPNTDKGANQASFTADGTMYFVGKLVGRAWNAGIYRSRYEGGLYQAPEPLGEKINTTVADSYPWIAPDESYLLFGSSRPGGNSVETDLYIAFRNDDDTWSDPIHIGEEINNGSTVSFAGLSHDGKYLFFNRFDEDDDRFYWVDARYLDQYRP